MLLLIRLFQATRRRHVLTLLLALVVVVIAGAAAFAATQGIAFTTGLYWAVTTATTVGYGDVTPHNPTGRLVASIVMLTSIPLLGATFALVTGAAAAAGLRRILQMGTAFPRGSYRLVVGMHPAVPAVIEELVKAECAVVLVADVDPVSLSDEVHLVRGDPTDPAVIRRARPAGAVHALVAAPSDGDVLVMTVLLREQAPELAISALCSSRPVREALKAVGVDQAVSVDELLSHMLAKSLETPHAGDLLLRLVDSERHRLVETEVESSAIGATLSAVRRDRHGLVLGIVHDGSVDLGIADDPTIAAGDHLLVAEPTARRSPASETP